VKCDGVGVGLSSSLAIDSRRGRGGSSTPGSLQGPCSPAPVFVREGRPRVTLWRPCCRAPVRLSRSRALAGRSRRRPAPCTESHPTSSSRSWWAKSRQTSTMGRESKVNRVVGDSDGVAEGDGRSRGGTRSLPPWWSEGPGPTGLAKPVMRGQLGASQAPASPSRRSPEGVTARR
jgi:hypothetical protein